MIDRRLFIGTLVSSIMAAPSAADAQPSEKVLRIGYLGSAEAESSPESDRIFAAFVQGLIDSGFVEGTNMVLERRAMAGRTERAPALIAELIALPFDILVVVSPAAAARAANTATTTIPIVMIPRWWRNSASCARLGAVNGMTGVSSRSSTPCIRACMRGVNSARASRKRW